MYIQECTYIGVNMYIVHGYVYIDREIARVAVKAADAELERSAVKVLLP